MNQMEKLTFDLSEHHVEWGIKAWKQIIILPAFSWNKGKGIIVSVKTNYIVLQNNKLCENEIITENEFEKRLEQPPSMNIGLGIKRLYFVWSQGTVWIKLSNRPLPLAVPSMDINGTMHTKLVVSGEGGWLKGVQVCSFTARLVDINDWVATELA